MIYKIIMEIKPIAFDSLGVRSTATFVQTDKKILIDPGADVAPKRYGLPPSRTELDRLNELSQFIQDYAQEAEILIITHYHHDHYFPQANFYEGKILLIKHPKKDINFSQKRRSSEFLRWVGKKPEKIEFIDGRTFKFKKTGITFSPAVRHGESNSKLGFVVMCSVSFGREKLVHATDVQGPQLDTTTQWIVDENPDVLIISGCPTMFLGSKLPLKGLEDSNKNLVKILQQTKVKTIILDHHLVRDVNYKNKIEKVLEVSKELDKKVITAAEFSGKPIELLEAQRKKLWEEES
jgi:hypothetical protein